MIRPFDLRDLKLVKDLEPQRVVLDSRMALCDDYRPFQNALLAYLLTGRGTPTLVLRQHQAGGDLRAFGQWREMQCSVQGSGAGRVRARLTALALEPSGKEVQVWPQLLDALVEQVGQHGVIGMSAEVDDTGFWFELLQQADFSVYNRQEIWKLQPNAGQHEHPGFQLRLGTPADRWAVQQLISNTVPPLIQQVESDEGAEAGFLWEEGGDVLAFLRVYRGQRGTWLKPFFHPRAESVARQLIQQATAMCAPQVLYCCVRRYQQWLSRPLEESGFESLGTQAVMVRNVAVRLPRPALSPAPMREKGLEVTTPIAHSRAGGAK